MITSSYIHHLRFGCRQLAMENCKLEQLLAGSGLTELCLEEIYALATADQFQIIFKNYLTYGGPNVAFRLASKLRLSDLGPLGYLLLSSDTLEETLHFINQYSLLVGPLMQPENRLTQDELHIHLKHINPLNESVYRFSVEYFISALNHNLSELARKPIIPKSLYLRHTKPSIEDTYAMLPIKDIRFEQDQNLIIYNLKGLRRPLPFSDKAIKKCSRELCDNLLLQLTKEITITARLTSILAEQPGSYPDIKSAASRLDMSPRTLRRRLADENTTFQDLLSQHRKQFALELLQNDHLPIQSVAYACGFSEVQNFSSAFKRWMGVSPTEYRSQIH